MEPGDLSAEQRDLYDQITGGPRAAGTQVFALTASDGTLNGPFNAMLLSPPVGAGLQGLGAAVRYGSSLSPRTREMAILLVAAHWDCLFERHAHEAVGRDVGLSNVELQLLAQEKLPPTTDPAEAAALAVVDGLLRRADLDDAEYDVARAALGERQLFELSTLVGYYATLAMQLRIFRVGAPASIG